MPVRHATAVIAGDLVSPTLWNADHTITGPSTMVAVGLVGNPNGSTSSLTGGVGWEDIIQFAIPCSSMMTMDTSHLTVTAEFTQNAALEFRVIDSNFSAQLITITKSASANAMFTEINSQGHSWFGSSTVFVLQAKSDISGTLTMYHSAIYLRETA